MTARVLAEARRVAMLARRSRPALGAGRLICVDGPSGSGKSTLGEALADLLPDAVLVSTDDVLHGWDGLAALPRALERALAPLGGGEVGHHGRFDWHADRVGETVTLPPRPWYVVEGVGAGTRLLDPWRSLLVWVEAPRALRLARGIERDGEVMAAHWRRWGVREDALHAAERTRDRADAVVRGW